MGGIYINPKDDKDAWEKKDRLLRVGRKVYAAEAKSHKPGQGGVFIVAIIKNPNFNAAGVLFNEDEAKRFFNAEFSEPPTYIKVSIDRIRDLDPHAADRIQEYVQGGSDSTDGDSPRDSDFSAMLHRLGIDPEMMVGMGEARKPVKNKGKDFHDAMDTAGRLYQKLRPHVNEFLETELTSISPGDMEALASKSESISFAFTRVMCYALARVFLSAGLTELGTARGVTFGLSVYQTIEAYMQKLLKNPDNF